MASGSAWGAVPISLAQRLRLNGKPHTVIGVAPAGFSGISGLIAPEVWLPLGLHSQITSAFSDGSQLLDLNNPKNYTLNVMARLQPGLTLTSVQPRLPVIADRLTAIQPPDAAGTRELQVLAPSRFSISTTPSDDGPLGLMSVLLAGMAGIVLLIASLNLINMLLARGTARSREIAMRIAIGATRWQIVRQLLVEGLVLALAGGAVGLLLARWANTLLGAIVLSPARIHELLADGRSPARRGSPGRHRRILRRRDADFQSRSGAEGLAGGRCQPT